MCGHSNEDAPDDDQRPRSILGRVAERWPRSATTASACCWLAAVTILILHSHHTVIRSEMTFGLDDIWLIGLGSVGVPILLLGSLGRHLTPRALEMISAVCFTVAIGLTILIGAGLLHVAPLAGDFTVIPFLAMAVQSLNGAYGLDKRERIAARVRAEERAKAARALEEARRERDAAVEDAYLAALVKAHEVQHTRVTEVSNVLAADTEDLSAACALLQEELDVRHTRHAANGHARNGHNGHTAILRLVNGSRGTHAPTGTEPD